ncbi:MAG: heterodisulfide reductase-related iron-sulfur binding cluster [Rhodospirillaceae bacterium]
MREGSLEAPIRHPLNWQDEAFYDAEALDEELRRVFDICHGCRRCFNLCDSFPRLFDLIDDSESGELDSVESADFKPVVDACTLCDMCFLTKCPYVPPHEFNLDFPHLMLRYRAIEARDGKRSFAEGQLTQTDRNGKIASMMAPVANWASSCDNHVTRPLMEKTMGVDRNAELPQFTGNTLVNRAKSEVPEINTEAPAYGRKAVLYATCFGNFNNPEIGIAARQILARNGVETEVVYPSCCGMPQMEQGDIAQVAKNAATVAAEMADWIDRGYAVIALVPSCALMLKFEWPLIVPDNAQVKSLSEATFDIDEFIVDISRKEGIADGIEAIEGGATLHIACHSRAQNFGQKSADMLRLIPDFDLNVIERCAGHGGSWGIMKDNFETAIKVGKPVARQASKAAKSYVVSGCPLARSHILQGMERIDGTAPEVDSASHPVQILARAYGY